VVSVDGIAADPLKIAVIQEMPPPTNLKELRSIIGGFSYLRKYIKNFADIAEPLTSFLGSRNKLEKMVRKSGNKLDPEAQAAFQKLKDLLCKAPVLAHPDFNRPFIVHTDASPVGLGATLLPKNDQGQIQVVQHISR
jgi:hypothetical protein